jgi:hypothetical protein
VVAGEDVDRVELDGAKRVEQVDRVLERGIAEVLGAEEEAARFVSGQACAHLRRQ